MFPGCAVSACISLFALERVPRERVRLIETNGIGRPLAEPAPALPAIEPAPAERAVTAASVEVPPKTAVVAAVVQGETTIRLNVTLLDSLMTLAGELVLSRNQLVESLSRQDERGIRSGAQRVSRISRAVCQGKLSTFFFLSRARMIMRAAVSANMSQGMRKVLTAVMGVLMKPGQIVVTAMPRLRNWIRKPSR